MPHRFEADVKAWDGKSKTAIEQVYDRACTSSTFLQDVLALFSEADAQVGATWLLKKHLDSGNEIDAADTIPVFRMLDRLEHWEACLHVLQCLPAFSVPSRYKKKTETFLRRCLADENKFVRAWAYNGMYELAKQYPQYRVEVSQLLETALEDEPASVKARVRRCVANWF